MSAWIIGFLVVYAMYTGIVIWLCKIAIKRYHLG